MTHMTMTDLESYIQAAKGTMDIVKSMVGMLPKGKPREDAEVRLADAEKALRAAEVQLAKSLDYHLCQCTFPPQIMLSQGRHPTHDREIFKCSNCGKQEPSLKHFQNMDEADAEFRAQRNTGYGIV